MCLWNNKIVSSKVEVCLHRTDVLWRWIVTFQRYSLITTELQIQSQMNEWDKSSPNFKPNFHLRYSGNQRRTVLLSLLQRNIMLAFLLPDCADILVSNYRCCWKDRVCFGEQKMTRWSEATPVRHLPLKDGNNKMLVWISGHSPQVYLELCVFPRAGGSDHRTIVLEGSPTESPFFIRETIS